MTATPPPSRTTPKQSRAGRARYRRIMRFATRYLVQAWWYELFLPRVGLARVAARGRTTRLVKMARNFHVLAVDLGGLMIKVGQFLSTRLDVLPPAITAELSGLQDEVPAVPFDKIRAVAEESLGAPLSSVYSRFEEQPLAAASLGQAHRARLADPDAATAGFHDVVVKIQRPGIDEVVDIDIAALRRVAQLLSRVALVSRRVDLPALCEEFAQTSFEEIDYVNEAANAERFHESFAADPRVNTPRIAWERASRRVLTMADVTAIKISDLEGLRTAGIDPTEIAQVFAEVMFEQIFTHGFFHADPHPGNVFVTLDDEPATPGKPAWSLTFIDFGMMGAIPDSVRRALQSLVVAVVSRDSRAFVAGMRSIGVLMPSADAGQLEQAMSLVFDRFGGLRVGDMQNVDPRELQDFGAEFGDTIRAMPFQFPENFLLVVRAISLVSGVCSTLAPDFNMWTAAEPYATRLLREQSGGLVRSLGQQALTATRVLTTMPARLDEAMSRVERGDLAVDTPRLDRRVRALERIARRILSAVLFSGLLVAGAVLLPTAPVLGVVLMSVSVLPLGHAVFAGLR